PRGRRGRTGITGITGVCPGADRSRVIPVIPVPPERPLGTTSIALRLRAHTTIYRGGRSGAPQGEGVALRLRAHPTVAAGACRRLPNCLPTSRETLVGRLCKGKCWWL